MNIEYVKVNGTDIAAISGDQAEITTPPRPPWTWP